MCIALVGGTFGAIHCFAWNASFPTHTALASLSHCGHRGIRRCISICSVDGAIRIIWNVGPTTDYVIFRSIVIMVIYACTRIPCAQGSTIWGLSNAFLDGVLATYLLFRADVMTSSDDHK